MGSGHFLVAELRILVAIRMEEEGLSQEEAVKAVLRDNLFGLELEPRCTQIAAFNLALAAWKLMGRPGPASSQSGLLWIGPRAVAGGMVADPRSGRQRSALFSRPAL